MSNFNYSVCRVPDAVGDDGMIHGISGVLVLRPFLVQTRDLQQDVRPWEHNVFAETLTG